MYALFECLFLKIRYFNFSCRNKKTVLKQIVLSHCLKHQTPCNLTERDVKQRYKSKYSGFIELS